jgi:tellurite resistance protein TerC
MSETTLMWVIFILLMIVMLAIDLGLNRHSHRVGMREALTWSCVWVTLALLFNLGIYLTLGREPALEFLAGYLIEKSLSVDNLFVFIMIFAAFGIGDRYQGRILKWGIIGALLMRAVFIFAGIELLAHFRWLFWIFGALLIVTAAKMAFGGEGTVRPERNLAVRLVKRVLPITRRIHGDWFITRRRGILLGSPLLVALVMVEASDVIFALDSIPAIFAITLDPFIVFTSNVFAILGLRALYFLLAGLLGLFVYLKYGISFILAFVGSKMLLAMLGIHIPIAASLGVIAATLAIAILASFLPRSALWRQKRKPDRKGSGDEPSNL